VQDTRETSGRGQGSSGSAARAREDSVRARLLEARVWGRWGWAARPWAYLEEREGQRGPREGWVRPGVVWVGVVVHGTMVRPCIRENGRREERGGVMPFEGLQQERKRERVQG
jgi:hypothetical protein